MDPVISIVMPTFNRRASVVRALEALSRQSVPVDDFEVVVVDDGSSDGTIEALHRLRPAFALTILQQPHDGPARARNLGVQRARGKLILFIDDDVVAEPDLIAEHLRSHRDLVNRVVIGPMLPPQNWARPAWIRWEEDKLQLQYQALMTGAYQCSPRQFFTGNASLNRSSFLEVGGFDATFKRAEDVELALRLEARGAQFHFNSQAKVQHYAYRTFDSWSNMAYQYGRYDVEMQRLGGDSLGRATWEFHRRHPLNRWLTRACLGRPLLMTGVVGGLRTAVALADAVGNTVAGSRALSAIFNLRYWQGACDELGSVSLVWQQVKATASVSH